MRSVITIHDTEGCDYASSDQVVLWRGYNDALFPGGVPILQIVEERADTFKRRYLAWVHELGAVYIERKSAVDRLELRPGFSYWWMTPIVEKGNHKKSTQINDAIKLMAFVDWVAANPFSTLRLNSDNAALAECLRYWCLQNGKEFLWAAKKGAARPGGYFGNAVKLFGKSLRKYVLSVWSRLKALIWLARYVFVRWPLRGVGIEQWRDSDAELCFISYLFNLSKDSLAANRYKSSYWGDLPSVLQSHDCPTAWMHIYAKSDSARTPAEAAAALKRLNCPIGEATGQVHVALDSFLSMRVIINSVRDWFRVGLAAGCVEHRISNRNPGGLNLWPLYAAEWQQSSYGAIAMSNVLYLNLFESAFAQRKALGAAIYLHENMDWEYAFLWAWKAFSSGNAIAFPHSTVRYWDLRYFSDPRTYQRSARNSMPMADIVAVNSAAMEQIYRNERYPVDKLVSVEALRFFHLLYSANEDAAKIREGDNGLRVLVLTDFTAYHTDLQMQLLARAASLLPSGVNIRVKPHPAHDVILADYPELSLATISYEPLGRLLASCDVAYCSAVTSAAVEAYCAGIPVVVSLDPDHLNMSPLRGVDGVRFVSSPAELSDAFRAIESRHRERASRRDCFFLELGLPRWRQLLRDNCHTWRDFPAAA